MARHFAICVSMAYEGEYPCPAMISFALAEIPNSFAATRPSLLVPGNSPAAVAYLPGLHPLRERASLIVA